MKRKNERKFTEHYLSKRETQIMDVVYKNGTTTITELVNTIPDSSTKDSIRRMVHILEEKGFLKHKKDGFTNVYYPVVKKSDERKRALDRVVETFFGGSPRKVVAALIDIKKGELNEKEIEELRKFINSDSKEDKQK